MKCKICGCTDEDCKQCIDEQGYPCHWVEEDLCSRCCKGLENEVVTSEQIIEEINKIVKDGN